MPKPCKDGDGNTLEGFYLREAQRYLDDNVIQTPKLREALQIVIDAHLNKYKK